MYHAGERSEIQDLRQDLSVISMYILLHLTVYIVGRGAHEYRGNIELSRESATIAVSWSIVEVH